LHCNKKLDNTGPFSYSEDTLEKQARISTSKKKVIPMYSTQISRQLLAAQKESFDDFFSSMVAMHEFVEKMTRVFYEQVIWFPEETMRLYDQWIRSCKTGRDQMKMTLDRNMNRVLETL
jgi:glucan phosphorylase